MVLRSSSKMTQADVVYADVNFTKFEGKKPGGESAETTFSEVRIKQLSDSQKQALLAGGSKVTTERVALIILSVLLTAAVGALIGVSLDSIQTKKSLNHIKDRNRNLTAKLCAPCPKDWEEHEDQCYFFSELTVSWQNARKLCRQQEADLVRIDSEDEQTFLTKRLSVKMEKPEDKFWIGLTDTKTEGTWLWADGSPLDQRFKFWSKNEPDNYDRDDSQDGEDCTRMGEKSNVVILTNWFDKACNSNHKSICEKSAVRGHPLCV